MSDTPGRLGARGAGLHARRAVVLLSLLATAVLCGAHALPGPHGPGHVAAGHAAATVVQDASAPAAVGPLDADPAGHGHGEPVGAHGTGHDDPAGPAAGRHASGHDGPVGPAPDHHPAGHGPAGPAPDHDGPACHDDGVHGGSALAARADRVPAPDAVTVPVAAAPALPRTRPRVDRGAGSRPARHEGGRHHLVLAQISRT